VRHCGCRARCRRFADSTGAESLMRSRRTIVILLTAWVVALFVAGGVWRAFHPPKPEPAQNQDLLVASRQEGYYACLNLPAGSPVRLDAQARKRFLARKLPHDDQAAALTGCGEALRR
jgi:hypothetical protein